MLELHCHTTFSDGTLTPAQLVDRAFTAGVRALAITDHDTISGWDEAIASAGDTVPGALRDRLEIVPGLELSTVHNGRSLHILGFYPDPNLLLSPLQERLAGRKRRAQAMAAKLAELGYPIELPQMGEGVAPARPHLASALVRAGYVQSSREAFDRFLRDDGPAYVHYEKFSSVDGVKLLRSCHAVPVWAHPFLFRGGEVEEVLPELVEAGLMGIEVYHPSHSAREVRILEALSQQYGLIKTGGSDYHGPGMSGGEETKLNSLHLPLELLEALKAARSIA